MAEQDGAISIYPAQPSAGVIRLHEATPQRLVLDIPPGKNSNGLGCFAVLWNSFMVVFTSFFVTGFDKAEMPQGPLVVVLVIGLFWAVGLGLIFGWLKMRYERCFLLVEPDRAVLRKMFLGRQRQKEQQLDTSSKAQLTEAYQQNDVPVYRVTINGKDGKTLHFGTSLEQAEKDWCVDVVNTLLQPKLAEIMAPAQPASTVCEACGADISADAFHNASGLIVCSTCDHEQAPFRAETLIAGDMPEELPGVVKILEESPLRLGLRLKVAESGLLRGFVAVFTGVFSAIWYSAIGSSVLRPLQLLLESQETSLFDWLSVIFLVPFLLGGLMPLSICLLAVAGRLTTWIDQEFVKIRLHAGPFGKTWTMNTTDVTEVRLVNSSEMPSRKNNPRIAQPNPRVSGSHEFSKAAGIFAGKRVLAMTAVHSPLTARFVTAKVRDWLNDNALDKRLP